MSKNRRNRSPQAPPAPAATPSSSEVEPQASPAPASTPISKAADAEPEASPTPASTPSSSKVEPQASPAPASTPSSKAADAKPEASPAPASTPSSSEVEPQASAAPPEPTPAPEAPPMRHNTGIRGPRVGAAPDLAELLAPHVTPEERDRVRGHVIPSPGSGRAGRRDVAVRGGAPVEEPPAPTQHAVRGGAPSPNSGRAIRRGAPRSDVVPHRIASPPPTGHPHTAPKARIGGEPMVAPKALGAPELARAIHTLGVAGQRVESPTIRAELQSIQGSLRRLLHDLTEE